MSSYTKFDPSKDITTLIVRCPFSKCHARIIKPSVANVHELKTGLKFLKVDKQEEEKDDGKDGHFLKIQDAWDFDNIGVSRDIKEHVIEGYDGEVDQDVERLIVCADCERGPLGFAKFDEGDVKEVKNLKFYLHLNSCLFQH